MAYLYSPIVELENEHLRYQMIWNPEVFSTGFNPIGNGWALRTATNWNSSSIQEISSPIGSKIWRRSRNAGELAPVITHWTNGPNNVRDVEILTLQRYSGADSYAMGNFHRITSTGNLSGYFLGFRNNTTELRSRFWVNGVVSNNGEMFHEFGNPINRWFWIRSQSIGTQSKLRVWEYGTAEPTSWQIERTNTEVESGGVGEGDWSLSGHVSDIAWYSVGVNGLPAPADFSDVPLQVFIQSVESDGPRYTVTGSLSDFGDVYGVATLPYSGNPSPQQVFDGEDSSGDPARGTGSQIGVTNFSFDITGLNLEDNPSHQIHVVGRKLAEEAS